MPNLRLSYYRGRFGAADEWIGGLFDEVYETWLGFPELQQGRLQVGLWHEDELIASLMHRKNSAFVQLHDICAGRCVVATNFLLIFY